MSLLFSKLLLLLLLPIIFFYPKEVNTHPFHVSTTEISYNSKNKSLEVTCRIFTDDFENVLAKRSKAKIDLYAKGKETEMNAFIKSYIETNLKFYIDGKLLKPSYIGFENDHEATNIYLEIASVLPFKKLALSNGILYDLFEDQMNILHVEKNGTRKSTKANFPEKQMAVSF